MVGESDRERLSSCMLNPRRSTVDHQLPCTEDGTALIRRKPTFRAPAPRVVLGSGTNRIRKSVSGNYNVCKFKFLLSTLVALT